MDLLEKSKLQKELNDDLSPGLLRQRRNLMVVSLIIIFMEMSGAQLGNVLLLGISITFDNPESIPLFLMFFLVYFLYRYTLYYWQERHSFWSLFSLNFEQKTRPKIYAIWNEKGIPVEGQSNTIYKSGTLNFFDLEVTGLLKRRVSENKKNPFTGEIENKTIEFNIFYLWKEFLSAAFIVLFKERFVTDYYMPYLIALVAVYLKFV